MKKILLAALFFTLTFAPWCPSGLNACQSNPTQTEPTSPGRTQPKKQPPNEQEPEKQLADGNETPQTKPGIQLEAKDNSVDVKIDGQLFTTLDHASYDKPIFYPVFGPRQTPMTRNWPMKQDVAGEAHDHPHHKSLWFSHEISGVDFWSEKGGIVETSSVDIDQQLPNTVNTTSNWIRRKDRETILTDSTRYQFGSDASARWIDCTITVHASHGEVTFEDTKEGLFAIRTHPDLRLTASPKEGVTEVFGQASNSEGINGKQIWGKQAKWVLYQGEIDGVPVGIAIFDHPSNLRHPTTWHAREYGLIAANPFGLHHFLGKEKGSGEYKLKPGESLRLRYRVLFMQGPVTADQVNQRFQSFEQPTPSASASDHPS